MKKIALQFIELQARPYCFSTPTTAFHPDLYQGTYTATLTDNILTLQHKHYDFLVYRYCITYAIDETIRKHFIYKSNEEFGRYYKIVQNIVKCQALQVVKTINASR